MWTSGDKLKEGVLPPCPHKRNKRSQKQRRVNEKEQKGEKTSEPCRWEGSQEVNVALHSQGLADKLRNSGRTRASPSVLLVWEWAGSVTP